jgi:hypothetical protein
MADILEKIAEGMTEIREMMKAAPPPPPQGIQATSGVHFHGSSGLTIVGVTAIVIAVAAVLVVSAFRSADLRDMQKLRDDMDMAAARIEQHERRINKVEAEP